MENWINTEKFKKKTTEKYKTVPTEVPELKNAIIDQKNALEDFNTRLSESETQISEMEDKTLKHK